MKIKTYFILFAVLFIFLTAGLENGGLREGFRLGDVAPEINILGTDSDVSFANNSSRYTLLHFWAAYDGNSRKQNILLWNYLKKSDLSQIKMISVSMDTFKSVFNETIKTDGLSSTNQLNERQGKKSDVYRKYGLNKGLRNFLIDDKGVIIATNITPETLEKIIH
jgi:hypothetical protein